MLDFSTSKTELMDKVSLEVFDIITDVSRSILWTFSMDELLEKSINKIVNKYNMLGGLIFLLEGDYLYAKTIAGKKKHSFLKLINRPVTDLKIQLNSKNSNRIVDAVLEKKVQFSYNLYDFTRGVLSEKVTNGAKILTKTKSCIAIPIEYKGKAIGALFFSKSQKKDFDYELPLLRILSDQIGIAIVNARLYSEVQLQLADLERRNSQLEIINNFTNNVITTLEVDEVAQKALDYIPEGLGYLGAMYFYLDHDTNFLKLIAFSDTPLSHKIIYTLNRKPSTYEIGMDDRTQRNNVNVRAIESGEIVLTDSIEDLTRRKIPQPIAKKIQKMLSLQTIAAVPIKNNNEIIGVIDFLIQAKNPKELTIFDRSTISIIANQIGIALSNAASYNKAKKTLDTLQQVYNRDREILDILGHELRTPLTIGKGNLELLISFIKSNKEKLPHHIAAKIMKMVNQSYSSILKESALVSELLTTTKLDNGHLVILNEPINIYEIAQISSESYKSIALKNNLKLKFISSRKKIPETLGDKVRLSEVIDNLISNAIKYTKEGWIEVWVDADTEKVKVHVKDTGGGIPPEEKENVFQKFYRLHHYVNNDEKSIMRPGGTGLGLYISKGIIEAHNGQIWVESDGEKKGSEFIFSIPIKKLGESLNTPKEEVDLFVKMNLKTNAN